MRRAETMVMMAAGLLLLWAGTASAAATAGETCAAKKMKAAGKYSSRQLICHGNATRVGPSYNLASCLTKAQLVFEKAFGKAEFTAGGGSSRLRGHR